MSVGQMIAAAFGLAIIAVVLWNLRPTRHHGEGDAEAWQTDGESAMPVVRSSSCATPMTLS